MSDESVGGIAEVQISCVATVSILQLHLEIRELYITMLRFIGGRAAGEPNYVELSKAIGASVNSTKVFLSLDSQSDMLCHFDHTLTACGGLRLVAACSLHDGPSNKFAQIGYS